MMAAPVVHDALWVDLMGKPYQMELAQLPAVHDWAMTVKPYDLARFVDAAKLLPMYAVGSGGSLGAAAFAAMLHRWTAHPSRYLTPQILSWEPSRWKCATLLVSAGGRNPEILDALRVSKGLVGVVCATKDSPLERIAQNRAYVHAARPPSGKDGFLATNSLLATCVWLAATYGRHVHAVPEYAMSWKGLMEDGFERVVKKAAGEITNRRHVMVLADAWGWPAAVDAESRCHESGLAAVQVTDWRNFAHGRHNWLAVHGDETAILALVSPQSVELAGRTLELVPNDIPVARLETCHERPAGALNLLVKVMHLVGEFGRAGGTDPGRPKVADFGRKIHHMNDHPAG